MPKDSQQESLQCSGHLSNVMRMSCNDWQRLPSLESLHTDSDYDDCWKGPEFPADTGIDSPFRNPALIPET